MSEDLDLELCKEVSRLLQLSNPDYKVVTISRKPFTYERTITIQNIHTPTYCYAISSSVDMLGLRECDIQKTAVVITNKILRQIRYIEEN